MRVLTWNVDGLDHKRIGARMEKLCVEIFLGGDLRAALEGRPVPPMPEVIGFQEMTRHAHGALRQSFFSTKTTLVAFWNESSLVLWNISSLVLSCGI